MSDLSDRDFWLRRRSTKKKAADPIVTTSWIVALAIAAAILGGFIYDFTGMGDRQTAAPSHVIISPSTPAKAS